MLRSNSRIVLGSRRFGLALLPIAAAAGLAVSASSASAANIDPLALGSQLAGGTLTVTWVAGPGAPMITTTGIIMATGVDSAVAFVPDPFGNPGPGATFRITGDTFVATWSLGNMADAFIIEALFDLAPSISVFDDGSLPDTPGSVAGTDDVIYQLTSTAPMEIFADELAPWAGAKNTGDLFTQEVIRWAPPTVAGGGFAPQLRYDWLDDTDIIPAPGALTMLGLGGLIAGARPTRRQRN